MIEIENIRRVALNPGDVLTVTVKGRIVEEQRAKIHRAMETLFPSNGVVVLDDSVSIEVISGTQAQNNEAD